MKTTPWICVVLIAGVLLLAGCGGSYFRVTDPVSKSVYFTRDIDNEGGGSIRFKDSVSRRVITLQQSEVMEINKDQFLAAGRDRPTEGN